MLIELQRFYYHWSVVLLVIKSLLPPISQGAPVCYDEHSQMIILKNPGHEPIMTVVGMGNEKSISTKDGEGGGLQNQT